jgi:predicted phage tail protein
MADGTIGITEGSGSKLDAEDLTVGSTAVKRERVQIAGSTAAAIQAVNNADPSATAYGGAVRLVGQVAHDESDIGSPVKVGGKTAISDSPVSAAGDRANAWFNLNGALMVHQMPFLSQKVRLLGASAAATVQTVASTSTATSATQIIPAPSTGNYAYVTGIVLSATAAMTVSFQTPGGAVLWYAAVAANGTTTIFAPAGLYLFRSGLAEQVNTVRTLASGSAFTGLFYVTSSADLTI